MMIIEFGSHSMYSVQRHSTVAKEFIALLI